MSSASREVGIRLLAKEFIDIIQERLLTSDAVNILMSGGNTPLSLYKELLKSYSDFSWSKCRFIMVDERYVPFESSRSNAGMCYRHFGKHVNLLDFIYPDTSLPIEKCVDYFVKRVKSVDMKAIDIALLGTAKDGHIASIFPNSQPFFESGISFACYASEGQEKRVSLTLDYINKSDKIWMMAFGKEKQDILKRAQNNERNSLPALCLNDECDVTWFTSEVR